MKLEHIGIAVQDVKTVETLYNTILGIVRYKTETVEREGVRTHFLAAGNVKLELLEALHESSPVAKYLASKGQGLHHLAFEVEDADEAMRQLMDAGFKPLADAPKAGADGKRIFFLHPKQTQGVLVELCQSTPILFDYTDYETTAGTVRICERGAASNPVLLLLPNLDTPPTEWAGLVLTLEQQFRVLVFDPQTITVEKIENTLRQLQLANVYVVADSGTSVLTLEVARNQPKAIRKMVLYNFPLSKVGTAFLGQIQHPILLACDDTHPEAPHLFSVKNLAPSVEIAILPAPKASSSNSTSPHSTLSVLSDSGFIKWWCSS
ncbi:MAG TPA: methylmalonyl-CoA epimerase [Bacteroidetes bacterium]|nr:methylmalonyl-CoA epimerase [Bacteroidota bacterium]HRR09824.1 methylmalonyl-CoA epimerase [Rhodothermales bacterium]